MKIKTPTGKSLGFKKGDLVFTGAFPGIIISDVHTFAPCCEVWGIAQECGSVYATDLRKVSAEEFKSQAQALCHFWPLAPYTDVAKAALREAFQEVAA